jgi:hypothetical protein
MNIIAKAIARRDSLLAELQELTAFIRTAEKLEGTTFPAASVSTLGGIPSSPTVVVASNKSTEEASGEAEPTSVLNGDASPKRRERASPGIVAQTVAAVEEIIREVGRPIPINDMLHRLERRGIEVGGQRPGATLHARLSGVPSLSYNRGDGWSLRTEATGAAVPANLL